WYFDFPYDYYRERPLSPGSLFVDPDTGLLRRNIISTRKRKQNQDPNRVKHPVIQVPGHYLEADRCYDLRLTYRQRERVELRVRLLELRRETMHSMAGLSFTFRKGQRPAWFGGDATHLRGDFSLYLYDQNGFRFDWHEGYEYHSLGHRHASAELYPAGTLLVE
ncbi:MAG: hypothetical protein AAFZ52_05035, partial [Bacteroidota bacterium]